MGSYKRGYKSLIWVISIVTLLVTLLITTHEPLYGSSSTRLRALRGLHGLWPEGFGFRGLRLWALELQAEGLNFKQ